MHTSPLILHNQAKACIILLGETRKGKGPEKLGNFCFRELFVLFLDHALLPFLMNNYD